jgi:hypothetical protein
MPFSIKARISLSRLLVPLAAALVVVALNTGILAQNTIPPGAVQCGEGTYCNQGSHCGPGRSCVPDGMVDCGSYECPAGDACGVAAHSCVPPGSTECRNGTLCGRGYHCGRLDACVPNDSVDCGGYICPGGATCGAFGRHCVPPGSTECRDGGVCGPGKHCGPRTNCVPNE